ncbi:MAG: efflux RND transporter periplasmic adaptor subunit [Gemmatimonadetes bacterium]|nr:efflux RND transporter periplasmic adaptor subunit [Gemmatimonadota bacterium]
MPIDRKWARGALAVLTALALACTDGSAADERGAAGSGDSGGSTAAAAAAGSRRVINVEVLTVAERPFTEQVRLTGTAEADIDVTVAAEENGVIREVLVEKGVSLSAGDAMARIDDSVLRPQVEEARAQAALARETYERRRRLWEEDRVGSELAYLEAKYGAERAEATLRLLEERLQRTTIRSPINGILEDRFVEIGTLVSAGARVGRVVNVDRLQVVGGVPERYAADVRRGAPVRVTFAVLPDRVFEGRVSFVGATVNAENRTFLVEVTLPNPGRVVKPEMIANVVVTRRALESAVVIPQEALVRVEDGFVVFVIVEREGARVAESRKVEPGATQENQVVIRSGLRPGDTLVVVGQLQLASGDRVNIVAER